MAVGDCYYWGMLRFPMIEWPELWDTIVELQRGEPPWIELDSPYYGCRCRLLAVSKVNTALVEFDDGTKMVTLRMGLRKIPRKGEQRR